jgi:hypothetical protein
MYICMQYMCDCLIHGNIKVECFLIITITVCILFKSPVTFEKKGSQAETN